MISGETLAFAHLAILLVFLVAAGVSAHRARHGVRVGRRGDRYHRLTTAEVLKRIGRGRERPNGR